jgi:prepilin-type N-terminal cleavage/methylation domain-containing protein
VKKVASQKGFSLIELAIVLLLMALVMQPLVFAQKQKMRLAQDQRMHLEMEQLMLSLKGHLIQHGFLPCPADAQSSGFEARNAQGNCQVTSGYFPAQALALEMPRTPQGLMLDPWGRAYRYALSSRDANKDGLQDWSHASQVRAMSLSELKGDLRICQTPSHLSTCPKPETLSDTAIALVHSSGELLETSDAQAENVEIGKDRVWVGGLSATSQIDDVVRWISPLQAVAWLVQSGRFYVQTEMHTGGEQNE